jgi:hypothetical protein
MRNTKARAERLAKYLESIAPAKEEYGFNNGEWTIPAGRLNYYAAVAKHELRVNKILNK